MRVVHDDILYTGLVIDLFQAFREQVVCTDDFDLFLGGLPYKKLLNDPFVLHR